MSAPSRSTRDWSPTDAKLTDEETDNLIFLPGFSTAETISDISGRGVGMDVVKRSIQALGGRISIASRPGLGSTFTMSLPLTLAVLDGMVVTVAGQTLVIPLTAIVEIAAAQGHGRCTAFGGSSRVIGVRNGFIPLVDVGHGAGFQRRGGRCPCTAWRCWSRPRAATAAPFWSTPFRASARS